MALYIIIGLLAGIAAVLSVALYKVSKNGGNETVERGLETLNAKNAELGKALGEEFERNRRETQSSQREARFETVKVLSEMSEKIEKLKLENAESLSKLEKSLVKSLDLIKLDNAERGEKQSLALTRSVEALRESNEKKLEQMRATVDEKLSSTLSQRLDSSFKTVSDRLENVYKSLGEMKELSNGVTVNVAALNRVLSNVKARGSWAEVQLGYILDQTVPGMYETNFACVPGSNERVEFAVRVPSGEAGTAPTYLPVDSKFPMEDYVRLCSAADAADAQALDSARRALKNRAIGEAKTITKYINVPVTTPFAIMYLATEGLFAEIASSSDGTAEKIRSEYNVMIAGPTTITALLNSLALGFRAAAINEKANEVRILLAAAKAQYEKFGVVIQKARRKIDEAGKSLDEAGKRNEIIRKKLRSVEELGEGEANEILSLEDPDGEAEE